MRQFQLLLLLVFALSAVAINPFKSPFHKQISHLGNSPSTTSPEAPDSTVKNGQNAKPVGKFDLQELLNSNTRKPNLYSKAVVELKQLEDKPLCHRMAAYLLMNTCRTLPDNDQTSEFTMSQIQQNNIHSFALALAICDIEEVHSEVPKPCLALSSTAMQQVIDNGKDTLFVAPNQVQECLTSLSKNSIQWSTWLHRRNPALLLCRAASIDMDKDQLFESQKKLVQIMERFAGDLRDDLGDLKMMMKDRADEAEEYFEGFMNTAHRMKDELQDTMNAASAGVQGVASSIEYIQKRGADLNLFLQYLFKAAEEQVELAAQQHEQSLVVANANLEAHSENIAEVSEKTKEQIRMIEASMERFSSRAQEYAKQQEAMEERTESLALALENATELIAIHATQLERASLTAAKIVSSLGNLATITDFVAQVSGGLGGVGGSIGDWAIRITVPTGTMLVGSYGLPGSLVRNALLFIGGWATSEVIIYLRRCESWDWAPQVNPDSATVTASTAEDDTA